MSDSNGSLPVTETVQPARRRLLKAAGIADDKVHQCAPLVGDGRL